jgi:hypothetical protein
MKDDDALAAFGEILVDGASALPLRLAAVEGLGANNSGPARRILANVLRDARQPREVHAKAVQALVKGWSDTNTQEMAAYVYVYESAESEHIPQMMQPLLARGGDASADLLAGRYARFNHLKKLHALRVLGQIQTPRSFALLESLLPLENDPSLVTEILSAMKQFKGEGYAVKTREALIQRAKSDADPRERVQMLRLLADMAPKDAAAIAVEQLVPGANRDIVLVSIDILKKSGDDEGARALSLFKAQAGTNEYDARIEEALKAISSRGQ